MNEDSLDLQSGVPLSDVIETLRAELQRARELGQGRPIGFNVEKLEVELKVTVSRKAKAEAGVKGEAKFMVLFSASTNAGASGEWARDSVHTVKLTMTPVAAGMPGPVKISDSAAQPMRRRRPPKS